MTDRKNMSIMELANLILKENNKAMTFMEIYDRIAEEKEIPEDQKLEIISQVYADFILSAKFIYVGDDEWDIKGRQTIDLWDKDGAYYDEYPDYEDELLQYDDDEDIDVDEEEKEIEIDEEDEDENIYEKDYTDEDIEDDLDDIEEDELDDEFAEDFSEDDDEESLFDEFEEEEEKLVEEEEDFTYEIDEDAEDFDDEEYNEYMDDYEKMYED